jgi:dCMP deaminase
MKNEDQLYMDLACRVAKQSHCERAQVGSIIVKDNNIISYGYNGTPKGMCNCCEDEHGSTKSIVLHAESNAIIKAKKDLTGAKLYVTLSPCFECLKLIIQSGIKEVIYLNDYRIIDHLPEFKDIIKIRKFKPKK